MRSKKAIISRLLESFRGFFSKTGENQNYPKHRQYSRQFYARKQREQSSAFYKIKSANSKISPKITNLKISNTIVPRFSLSRLKTTLKFKNFPGFTKLNVKSRASLAITALLALVILAGGLVAANMERKAYAVLFNNRQIALVEDSREAEKALNELKAVKAKTWNRDVTIKGTVTYRETKAHFYNIDSISDLTKILDDKVTFVAAATGIKIDGKVSLVVKDKQTAEYVLDRVKQSFVKSDMNVSSVKFAEKIAIVQVPAGLKEILEPDMALEMFKNGRQKKVTHIVSEGDSLWSIARKYDMRVADLKEVNQDLKGEKLDIGQELNLIRLEPMVNVLVEGQVTMNETVPYDVVVEKDSSMWRGRQKIKQEGEKGSRQVTYKLVLKNGAEISKTVLAEKVLKPAKDRIVVTGARFVVASSRGGKLGWPTNGRINSGYGQRWGRMHKGLDIDGNTGQPIGAASDGRVTFAGWDGGYGKSALIDHGGGFVTRYAHMSKIEVKVGQKVSRGDLVGLVGSTGRSTGSHLHFEVYINGVYQNPRKYL